MTIEEFIDFVTASGFINENLGAREIGQLFNLSIQTYIDEINSDQHLHMKIIEFWEALARLADKQDFALTSEIPRDRFG